MKMDKVQTDEHRVLLEKTRKRETQERFATATITTETLAKLNIKIEELPLKCQESLTQLSQQTVDIENIDPVAVTLRHSKQLSQQLRDDYEILTLRQKDRELQIKIDRNKKVIDSLRKDLEEAKSSLASGNPNPETIQDHIRHLRQKVASYEESCEKAKTKFTKLSVSEGLFPNSLEVLISQLMTLKAEEMELKEKADDVLFSRQMRNKLTRLMR